jgi:hypothetical protein
MQKISSTILTLVNIYQVLILLMHLVIYTKVMEYFKKPRVFLKPQ